MDSYMIALRLVHVLSGAFWFGATVFVTLFLQRAVALEGPAGGQVMGRLSKIGMPFAFVSSMILAIGSGLLMFFRNFGGLLPETGNATQLAFAIGGAAAILAFLEGLLIHLPLQNKMKALQANIGDGGPSEAQRADMQGLLKKMEHAARASLVLLTVAVSMMAIARYL